MNKFLKIELISILLLKGRGNMSKNLKVFFKTLVICAIFSATDASLIDVNELVELVDLPYQH